MKMENLDQKKIESLMNSISLIRDELKIEKDISANCRENLEKFKSDIEGNENEIRNLNSDLEQNDIHMERDRKSILELISDKRELRIEIDKLKSEINKSESNDPLYEFLNGEIMGLHYLNSEFIEFAILGLQYGIWDNQINANPEMMDFIGMNSFGNSIDEFFEWEIPNEWDDQMKEAFNMGLNRGHWINFKANDKGWNSFKLNSKLDYLIRELKDELIQF